MLSIYEPYCDLRDLTVGKISVFSRWFSKPSETQLANRLSLDGAAFAEIVYYEQLCDLTIFLSLSKFILSWYYLNSFIIVKKEQKED